MTLTHTIAYADCFSGISGDMFLGALLHAGVDQGVLEAELKKLNIGAFTLQTIKKQVSSIEAIKVEIITEPCREARHLSHLLHIVENSHLSNIIKEQATEVFQELARAEAKVHGIAIDKVHFHEIGAIDTIVDVVGSLIGLHTLGVTKLLASPIPAGRGFIKCAHGTIPLPGPAVCEILKGVPIYGVNIDKELVTPTGAALIKVLSNDFGPMPPMNLTATGYGAGSHALSEDHPNLFRLIIGQATNVSESQEVEIIETNIDDCNPEIFPHVSDLLFTHGALDVNLSTLQMKKGRTGFKLQVICTPSKSQQLKQIVLSETTAIGLRFRREFRYTLVREAVEVKSPWGKITAKQVETPNGPVIQPEYEECRKIARRFGIPLQRVYREISKATKGVK